jgi:hypothetical protein
MGDTMTKGPYLITRRKCRDFITGKPNWLYELVDGSDKLIDMIESNQPVAPVALRNRQARLNSTYLLNQWGVS